LEERQKLIAAEVIHWNKHACIYGQLTGNCFNDRATELIKQCAKALFNNNALPLYSPTFLIPLDKKNASRNETAYPDFTALELYISMPNAQTSKVVAYLRDETKELVLDF
jgi:hypothetical protein